jgi:hypothetical protein
MVNIVESFRRGRARARAELPPALPRRNALPREGEMPAEAQKSFAEVSALADQQNARIIELEAELAASPAAIFAEVLRLPGVRTFLVARFHPDKHRDTNEVERAQLTGQLQKINAAYEALEKKGEP